MKKRVFSAFLAAIMLASMIVVPAYASGTGATPDWSRVNCPCGCGKTVAQLLNDSSAWTKWTYKKSTSGTVGAGHYYIDNASTTDGVWTLTGVYNNQNNVLLDLRGNALNASSSGAINVNGGTTMTLIDSVGGGQVSSYVATVTVAASGVFNAYNCTLTNHRDKTSTTAATLMGADGVSSAYLENCTIIGNRYYKFKRGSAIAVLKSNFTLKNCEVIGGPVTDNGGAIHLTSGSITIDGGRVTDGSADAAGDGIWINNSGTVTVKGGATVGSIDVGVTTAKVAVEGLVTIDCVNLEKEGTTSANAKLEIGELNSNSYIGVKAVIGKPITTGNASAYVKCIRSLVDGYAVTAGNDGKLELDVAPEVECIAVVGHDQSVTNYTSVANALADYDINEDLCLRVLDLEELALTENAVIDVNGKNFKVTGNASVTASFIDSANDDLDGCGNVTLEGVTLGDPASVDGKYYFAVEKTGAYSFHALEMKITSVSLATKSAGMYYYATYNCDDTLAANIESYGIKYELYDAEGVNEITTQDIVGVVTGGIENPREEVPILLMKNILGNEQAAAAGYTSAKCGEMQIKGTPYVKINGEEFTGETVSKSMYDLCAAVNTLIGQTTDKTLKNSYIALMQNLLYVTWADKGLNWSFTNIPAPAAA